MSEDTTNIEEIMFDIKGVYKKNEGNVFTLNLHFFFLHK